MNKYYQNLETNEWNAIMLFTHYTKLDEVVDIMHDVNHGDYFFDFDEGAMIPFEEGLECLVDNIGTTGLIYCELNRTDRHTLETIINKYSNDDWKKEYVKKVNETLDKRNEI